MDVIAVWLREYEVHLPAGWGWSLQIFLTVFLVATVNLVQRRVFRRLLEAASQTDSPWDEALLRAARTPITMLIWVLGVTFAVNIISDELKSPVLAAASTVRDVAVVMLMAFFIARFVRYAEENLVELRERKGRPVDRTTSDAVAKLIRLSVYITSALVILQTLGFSLSGVLAFGGIGAMAIGWSAKDLLANVFGGLMLYLDNPFKVGHWILSPDRTIEGFVEEIKWRHTVVRTFDKRQLNIPNSVFSQITVENATRMTHRRIKETVGIRYEDGDKMRAIIPDIRQMLMTHPEIDASQTLIVNFDTYGPSSLQIFVYCFTKTTEWSYYHEVKQDILLKIRDIILAHKADIAFPTSTVHVKTEGPVLP